MSDDLYIWIVRWGDFQHYRPRRDRGPAWIKHYTAQLNDERYLALTPVQRAILHDTRTAFAQYRGRLSAAPRQLTGRYGYRVTSAQLEALNHAGLIEIISRETLEQRLEFLYSNSPLEVEVEVEVEVEPSPTPPVNGRGSIKLSQKDLRRYTGCKHTRGTHGQGYKHTPLGTDKPPPDWPHDKPTRDQVLAALADQPIAF